MYEVMYITYMGIGAWINNCLEGGSNDFYILAQQDWFCRGHNFTRIDKRNLYGICGSVICSERTEQDAALETGFNTHVFLLFLDDSHVVSTSPPGL